MPDFDLGKEVEKPAPPPAVTPEVASLDSLEMDHELAKHYARVSRMVEVLEYDFETPVNQKAQAMNTLTAVLQQLVKIRTDLYTAERQRKLEQILTTCLKALPRAAQDDFLEMYERELQRTP